MNRSYRSEGVVIKRRNIGEADRIITIFTKRYGKIVAVAKGSRKITSRRAGSLEPATQAIFFFARSKTWDIITETQLLNSFSRSRTNLSRIIQVHQILEVVDLLTREHQIHPQVYAALVTSLKALNSEGSKRQLIVNQVKIIVADLGFGLPEDDSELALKAHLEEIADTKLRSKKMLI